MKNFWRVPVTSIADVDRMFDVRGIIAPQELFLKLRPRHGIVLAEWDESELVGKVIAFGVVLSVNIKEQSAVVFWRTTHVILRPNPNGRQFWRLKPFFKFANDVSIRYMLDDLFAELFPELDDMKFGETVGINSTKSHKEYQDIPGYVYLIESEYGYKIGKTVNIKSRTRLFEVKLPFPIKLINYSWFENYSKAESDFHKKFAQKRQEGEWFKLELEDIEFIKKQGKQVPVNGL
ncbi:GIY-YIG nuclease family protein [Shewanella gaetbuli]